MINKKIEEVAFKLPRIRKMHQRILELQISEPQKNGRSGLFVPASVFYMKQVPLTIVIDIKCTVEESGSKRVWVS